MSQIRISVGGLMRMIEIDVVRYHIARWEQHSTSIDILIMGKTGTGKSTLVNSLLGEGVAKEGDTLDPETAEVTQYSHDIKNIKIRVWDSPGLQDGLKNEKEYLEDIKLKCKENLDLFIYCIRMDEIRFVRDNPDIRSMKQLTESLGQDLWKHAIIVLTFANEAIEIEKEEVGEDKEKLQEFFIKNTKSWKEKLHQVLQEEVELPKDLAEGIEIVPAGYHADPKLEGDPEERFWLTKVWLGALLATKPRAQPALININEHRLMELPRDSVSDDDLQELIDKQRIIFRKKGKDFGERLDAEEAGNIVGFVEGFTSNMAFILKMKLATLNKMLIYEDPEDKEKTEEPSRKG